MTDAGLLVLRVGLGLSLALVLSMPVAEGVPRWPLFVLAVPTLFAVLGWRCRLAASFAALGWASVLVAGVRAAEPWYSLPIRDGVYVIMFASLALTGPGRYSVDRRRTEIPV